jgi:hypothetical protein
MNTGDSLLCTLDGLGGVGQVRGLLGEGRGGWCEA